MEIYTLNKNALFKEEFGGIKFFSVACIVSIILVYTTTINPSSKGYINQIPFYIPILIFLLFLGLYINSIYQRKKAYSNFNLTVKNGVSIHIEQTGVPDLNIDMKDVKRILHLHNGYYQLLMYHGDIPPEDLSHHTYSIPIHLIKDSDRLVNLFSHFKEVELQDEKAKLSIRMKVLMFLIIALVVGLMLGFFISKNTIFTFISGTFLIYAIGVVIKKDKKEYDRRSYFSFIILAVVIIKFAFTLKWLLGISF